MLSEYILVLGSNLGARQINLQRGLQAIREHDLLIKSSTEVLETAPFLVKAQNSFLNQGILIETNTSPNGLWEILQTIESALGRRKFFRYGPRSIDIDIVWWSKGSYTDQKITIPHIHNRSRSWVRKFIAELVPQAIDKGSDIKYKDMPSMNVRTIHDFVEKKNKKEKIVVLTCYDYTTANLFSRTSLDAVLVGDSLGNVIQGKSNTLSVSLQDVIYHARCVRNGLPDIFLIADMPFMTYKISRKQALKNASELIKQTSCDAVKVEGVAGHLPFIQSIVDAGIPVMGHLGLEPQMLLREGTYRLTSKRKEEFEKLLEDAKKLEEIGCFSIVLEMVPASVGEKLSSELKIPVIGIGAGVHTDGQVLVVQDFLGMNPDFNPRFCRQYLKLSEDIPRAIEEFCLDVREVKFPSREESF